jgi:hypothetical protein
METTFSSRTLAQIFRDLYLGERSGVLHATRGTLEKRIYFDRGMILYAESTLDGEDLGKVLVAEGKLSPGAVAEARRNVAEPKDLAQALVNRGLIGKETLTRTVRGIVERVVESLFQWDSGSARFSEEWLLHEIFESDILLTFEVILRGTGSMVGFDPIRDAMRGLDNRLKIRTPTPVPLERLALSPAHGYILSRVDGQASVADIVALLPAGEEDLASRFLYGLLVMGVLVFDPPVGEGPFDANAILRDHADTLALERAQESMILEAIEGMRHRNPHEVLGLSSNPQRDAIERAYAEMKERFSRDRMMPRVREKLRAELSLIESRVLEAYLAMSQVRSSEMVRPADVPPPARESVGKDELLVRVEMDKTRTQIAVEENTRIAESYFSKAKKYQREGDYYNAIQYGKLAVSYDPEQARYFFLLGECQAKNPDARWQRQAEQSFTKACQLDIWSAEYRVALGRFYRRRGLHLRARRQFEEALRAVPGHDEALSELKAMG